MTKLGIAAGLLFLALIGSPAMANRTFVSGRGADTGGCPITNPCRSFAYALGQTTAGGDVVALDSAGYGAATITRAVSIVASDGITAFVTPAAGADGITVNAGAGDAVVLRGLTINGQGVGRNGIVFNTGGSLAVQKCNLLNFTGPLGSGYGILLQPPSSASPKITISETNSSNNSGSGIALNGSSAKIQIDHVVANGNQYDGIEFENTTNVKFNISNSIASNNGADGFLISGTGILDSLTATANTYAGIDASGGTVLIGRSIISGSQYGLLISGGTVYSYGTNEINANTNDIRGNLTTAPLQ